MFDNSPARWLLYPLVALLLLILAAGQPDSAGGSRVLLADSPLPTVAPACNRPAADLPPRPDGCLGDEFPVAPPPEPIPPPCIAGWTFDDDYDGGLATSLLVTVEHPELQRYAPKGWIHLVKVGDAWQLVAIDAQVSCGKDEAPLAWATLQILNGGDWEAALGVYTGPLPADYLADLGVEAQPAVRLYLPLVVRAAATVPSNAWRHP